MIFADVGDNW